MTNIRRILLDRQRAFDEAMKIKGSLEYWKNVLLEENEPLATGGRSREEAERLKEQRRLKKLDKVPPPVSSGELRLTNRY